MSEEEKKAIDILVKKVDIWECKRPKNPIIFNGIIDEIDTENNAIRTVLKLITKLQKENEEKNITIEVYEKELDKIYEALNIERGVARLATDKIIKIMKDTIQKQLVELKNKDKRINDLEFALLDMVMQFANRIKIKASSYALDTMGLSTLELAFNELGFDEMYPVNKAEEKYEILEKKYYGN